MKWIKQINLTETLIEKLKELTTVRTFSLKSPLFYEGQVPIVAYLVLRGSIQLSKKKKLHQILRPGMLLGGNALLEKKPSDVTAEVLGNTTLCFIDRSTMLEIENNDSELAKILLKEKVAEENE